MITSTRNHKGMKVIRGIKQYSLKLDNESTSCAFGREILPVPFPGAILEKTGKQRSGEVGFHSYVSMPLHCSCLPSTHLHQQGLPLKSGKEWAKGRLLQELYCGISGHLLQVAAEEFPFSLKLLLEDNEDITKVGKVSGSTHHCSLVSVKI